VLKPRQVHFSLRPLQPCTHEHTSSHPLERSNTHTPTWCHRFIYPLLNERSRSSHTYNANTSDVQTNTSYKSQKGILIRHGEWLEPLKGDKCWFYSSLVSMLTEDSVLWDIRRKGGKKRVWKRNEEKKIIQSIESFLLRILSADL